jgi:hypothetical protein
MEAKMKNSILNSPEISILIISLEESNRSTEKGVERFVEPAAGTLMKAKSRTHNMVFGRRGSGKSSLLRKAAVDLTIDRHPIAYVDLETFKGHSYPDVLLSILIRTFDEFEKWLRTAAVYPANKTSFLKNLFGKAPKRPSFNRKEAEKLADKIKDNREELTDLLHSSDNVDIQKTNKDESLSGSDATMKGGLTTPIAQTNAQISERESLSSSREIRETYQLKKLDFLLRHILEYQEIFRAMSTLYKRDSFLFLDDLYYIKRSDQAKVIDYFHRIAKGNNLWIKIGTVRYRSSWYIHGDPPYGIKLGDDAQEINLDLTLENYSTTKAFLMKILQTFVDESGVGEIKNLMVKGAADRLVLASGGVARDFLGIFDRSILIAQGREHSYRGEKIGREDVNIAAGKYESTKMDEFRTDIKNDEEHISLEDAFKRIRYFCINDAKSNLFLYETLNEKGLSIIQELMDLRLIHKVNSHVTVSKRPGKYFGAYILDVSAYAEMRKKKDFEEIQFWKKGVNIRRTGFILEENYLLSNKPIEQSENDKEDPAKIEGKRKKVRQLTLDLPT